MKNLKKTLFFVSIFLIGTVFFLSAASAWSQTDTDAIPVFDKKPSTVLDLWENGGKGKYKDYVKLTNATLRQNISFNIYGYEQKNNQWIIMGSAQLKNHCDIDTVNSLWKGKINQFRWLAVQALDNIKFDAQATANSNDISITIFESIGLSKPQSNNNAPVFDVKSSVVLDLWENRGKGKYKDYVKLTNGTLNQNISFNIYGYDQKNSQWIIIGPSRLKSISDTDTVDSPWRGRINEFRWLAIHSLDNISFNAQAIANSNDIMIMIIDK